MGGRIEREWALRVPDESLVHEIRAGTGLSAAAAAILVNRGVTDVGAAARFLTSSLQDVTVPFPMKDLEEASRRLLLAGRRRETVFVYADYDADGATGAACLFLFLREAFPDLPVIVHQNHRVRDGYGMMPAHLDAAAAAGATLVVTVDCGISDLSPVRYARSLGMDVIVTDHHVPGPELPPALAVLNPKRADCPYPEKELAGVGVVFALLCGLRRAMREAGPGEESLPVLRRYLDLVALGTVADMVPLRGDNRIFVKAGIEEIRKSPRPGIKALLAVAGVPHAATDETDLGFRVAPRLNAAGRIGESGRSFEILVLEDEKEALALAAELNRDNGRRQAEEEQIFRDAASMIPGDLAASPFGTIVLSRPEWHPGILGIVASRIAERYFRPAVLLAEADGEAHGSCRSVDGFHLLEALSGVAPLLSRFGGHRHAAGVALPVANLPAFREGLDAAARRHAAGRVVVPRIGVDAEIGLSDVSREFMGELERLRPFGAGNEEPVLLARGLRLVRKTPFGAEGRHVRLAVAGTGGRSEVVAFNRTMPAFGPGSRLDLLFTPQRSFFRGSETWRLVLRDVRPMAGAGGGAPGGGATQRMPE